MEKMKEFREQTAKYKNKLDKILKGNKELYWSRTCDFLVGKINFNVYYFYINGLLPKNKIKVHNAFIMSCIKAISHKATLGANQSNLENNVSEITSKRKRLTKEELEKINKLELKEIIKNLGKGRRNGVKAKALQPKMQIEPAPTTLPPIISLTEEDPIDYHNGIELPLCIESKAFPTVEGLQLKVNAIAKEMGLSGGAEDSVAEVILHGLETHLQSIITNCLEKTRSKRLRTSKDSNQVSALQQSYNSMQKVKLDDKGTSLLDLHLPKTNDQTQYNPLRHTISTRDLLTSFTMSPYCLVETPNLLEKLVCIHNPASVRVKTAEELEAERALKRNEFRFY